MRPKLSSGILQRQRAKGDPMEYKYLCIRSQQTTSTKQLVQFGAPASEIDCWAGVPQKKRFDLDGDPVGETVGFQREENLERVKSLRDFYNNPENIIQNPILCSLRDIPKSSVEFVPAKDSHPDHQPSVEVGELVINVPDFSTLSIGECIKYVRDYIEQRIPALQRQEPNAALLRTLEARAAAKGYIAPEKADPLANGEGHDADSEAQENGDPAGVLFEESHIKDFWEELAARDELVKQIDLPVDTDSFLGFTRDALLSYLRPIVLVDGQHRLRGALAAAQERLDSPCDSIRDRKQNRRRRTINAGRGCHHQSRSPRPSGFPLDVHRPRGTGFSIRSSQPKSNAHRPGAVGDDRVDDALQ